MKKALSLFMAAMMLLSVLTFSAFAEAAPSETVGYSPDKVVKVDLSNVENILRFDYNNKEVKAYKITNASGLVRLSWLVENGYNLSYCTIYLANDIDMTGVDGFKPIGTSRDIRYRGVFDGQGHVIDNLKINKKLDAYTVGLFGAIGGGTTIKNVIFGAGSSVSCVQASSEAYVGGLIGMICDKEGVPTVVDNCWNLASVVSKGGVGQQNAGIVGRIDGYVNKNTVYTIRNTTNSGTVKCNDKAAGILSFAQHASFSIENCRNTGTVILDRGGVSKPNNSAAGIVYGGFSGHAEKIFKVTNCINNGRMEGPDALAGIYGRIRYDGTEIRNCRNYGELKLSGSVKEPLYTASDKAYLDDNLKNVVIEVQDLKGQTDETLPDLNAGKPSFPAKKTAFCGYQTKASKEGFYDLRLVAVGDSLDYDNVGFKLIIRTGISQGRYSETGGKKAEYLDKDGKVPVMTTVYNSLLGMGADNQTVAYTAKDLGGNYIFALNCRGIPVAEGRITVDVVTFHTENGVMIEDDVSVFEFNPKAFSEDMTGGV